MSIENQIKDLPICIQQHIKSLLGAELFTAPFKIGAVDGDILAYRTAAVCEEEFEGSCNAIIDATIRDIVNITGVQYLRFYLSGEDNFRFKIAKTKPYKGNRESYVKPRFLSHCKNYLRSQYLAYTVQDAEADDGIASDMVINGAIHIGIDKDLRQVPGLHYDYTKKEAPEAFVQVSEEEAVINLYRQVLTGDTSDNIPGLPRVGAVTAEKIIYDAATAEGDCMEFYKKICAEKLPEVNYFEYMEEQKALITMLIDRADYCRWENTVFIQAQTDGFVSQEGDFKGFEQDEAQLKLKGGL